MKTFIIAPEHSELIRQKIALGEMHIIETRAYATQHIARVGSNNPLCNTPTTAPYNDTNLLLGYLCTKCAQKVTGKA